MAGIDPQRRFEVRPRVLLFAAQQQQICQINMAVGLSG